MLSSLFTIFLDYRCNFACQHCSVGSSPKTVYPMPRELLLQALVELREVPSAKVVVFTGGEPTLRKELLLEGLRWAKEGGFLTRVVTNAWWARTPERAASFVDELKAAGLDELNTSYDDFHAPFVGLDPIANAVRAALDADLRVGMGVIVDENAVFNAKRVREELARRLDVTEAQLKSPKLAVLEDYPTPSGSGEGLDVSNLDAGDKLDMGCPEMMKTISIHPNGTVKACCGHVMFYEPDLTLGSLEDDPLPVIVERGLHNLLYWWIHMLGPKRILEKLGVEGTYTSICHACGVLLGEHREKLLDYLKHHRDEVLTDDVLLSDTGKRATTLFLGRRDEIMGNLQLR